MVILHADKKKRSHPNISLLIFRWLERLGTGDPLANDEYLNHTRLNLVQEKRRQYFALLSTSSPEFKWRQLRYDTILIRKESWRFYPRHVLFLYVEPFSREPPS